MKFVHLEHFAVVGIEVRTSNAREMTSAGAIRRQWERFDSEKAAGRIPQKAEPNPIAVYSHYASDEHGEYSYLLGVRVTARLRKSLRV